MNSPKQALKALQSLHGYLPANNLTKACRNYIDATRHKQEASDIPEAQELSTDILTDSQAFFDTVENKQTINEELTRLQELDSKMNLTRKQKTPTLEK